jgi:hypothetical protein
MEEGLRPRELGLLHRGDHGRKIGGARRIQERQRERDQHPTRGRGWIREHLPPLVAGADGLADLRLIGREVVRAERSAPLHDPVRDPQRHLAAIEGLGPFRAVALERVPELAEDEALTLPEDPALGGVDDRALGLVGEDRLEDLKDERLLGVDLHPIARELRRLPDELGERYRPEAIERMRQAGRGPRHSARRRADVEDLRRLRAEVDRNRDELGTPLPDRPPRDLDKEVQEDVPLPRIVDEHEPPRAEPGQRALDHERGEHGGHGGVDGVSSLPQHARAGLRSQRMARRHSTPRAHEKQVRLAARHEFGNVDREVSGP